MARKKPPILRPPEAPLITEAPLPFREDPPKKPLVLAASRDRLTENEEEWLLEDVFKSIRIDESLSKVNMSRRQFSRYLKDFPDFAKKFEDAQVDSCYFLENDMLNAHKKVSDPKLARVVIEAMNKVMVFRNPGRYSQKIDVSVNQQISIRETITAGNTRITEMFRDVSSVTNLLPAEILNKKK